MNKSLLFAMTVALFVTGSSVASAANDSTSTPQGGNAAGVNGAQTLSQGAAIGIGVGTVALVAAVALAAQDDGDESSGVAPVGTSTTTSTR